MTCRRCSTCSRSVMVSRTSYLAKTSINPTPFLPPSGELALSTTSIVPPPEARRELRRIPLLGTWVNKGKREGPGLLQEPPALTSLALELSLCALLAYNVALCVATTSPAVTWGGFGSKGLRCSATNSPALKVDCSSAALCSKTLVETITPSPASTQ